MDKLLPVLVDDTGPPQKQRTTGWVDFQGWEQIQHLDFEGESDEDMDRIAEGIRFLLEEDDLAELLYRYVEFHHGWSLVPGKIKEDAALYLRFEPIADERVSTIRATLEELCEEEYLDTDGSRFWYPR
jgi:hypothetical protein